MARLSSTFSHRDDLIERVLTEPKSQAKFYIDSGWPGDNYEVTFENQGAGDDRESARRLRGVLGEADARELEQRVRMIREIWR